VRILQQPADTLVEREIVAAAASEVGRSERELARLASRSGVQVPADEILFFPNTPVRVDKVIATRGSQVSGDLMSVSNTTLAIDAGLSPQDTKLVTVGLRVRIEDPETGIDLRGKVTTVADRPGTNPQITDPTKTAIEVTPEGGADRRLVGASVKLTIAVKSTHGKVLSVPLTALSVGADGVSRLQVETGTGRTRLVFVNPGLRAGGNVEIKPRRGALKAGDRVVVGTAATSAALKGPTGSKASATPDGVSPDQGGGPPSSAGAGPAATATATATAGGAATTTPGAGGEAAPPGAGGATGTPGATRGP
jgi:hypothetical protein